MNKHYNSPKQRSSTLCFDFVWRDSMVTFVFHVTYRRYSGSQDVSLVHH